MIDVPNTSRCPVCSEPIKPHWRICPMCETRLESLSCPACGESVKDNWKRCPQCETALLCPGCKRRLDSGATACPQCRRPIDGENEPPPPVFSDAICGIEMIHVPGGTFPMGDTLGPGVENEQPVHAIALDGFYMSTWAVTQEQWLRLMPDNPSRFEGPRRPVEQVTWESARLFARLLSEAHQSRFLFDLPTEAQWEYAARGAGKDQLYSGGDAIDAVAWYENNSRGRTHDVGTKAPNDLGLYDMSGNVWEWCRDSFVNDAYVSHAPCNPLVNEYGEGRVIRGGSWNLDPWSARCARRTSCAEDLMGPALGFRLMMVRASSN